MQDIVTRVKRVFGDEGGVQITDDDIIRWINDAQEKIGSENQGLLETTGVSDIVASQSDYDVPANMAMLRSLMYNGFHLKRFSFNEFNEYLNGFRATNPTIFSGGIPDTYMLWNGKLTLFPTPQQSITGGLTIYYIRHPTAVTTFADSLTVPLQYHNSIVDYCLQQAYELDEDFQKANQKKSQFDEKLLKMNDQNKMNEEYYPTITTLSEDENFGSWGFWGGYY